MRRKVIFERAEPTPCVFFLHEAALLMRLTGADVHRRQLDRILEVSAHPHITVHIVPFTAERYAGAGSALTCAHGRVAALDTVELESAHGCVFLDAVAPLAKYRATLDRMATVALSPRESRELIQATMEKL